MNITKSVRFYYYKITESIAFYPAIIAIAFLALSWIMLQFDYSDAGKDIKSSISWLRLRDAETARSIIATIGGAIISLTVFSFSMVMIVLNQAASQMSNRVLKSMIENRFQQIVLGIYIGTIVYALFLLSTIRDNSNGLDVPALSIYLLLLFTVIDIFLFIYFLDYVTQAVKYETVINNVRDHTILSMERESKNADEGVPTWTDLPSFEVRMPHSGYFQGISEEEILNIAAKNKLFISFCYKPSSFVLKGNVLLHIYSKELINDRLAEKVLDTIDIFAGQPIERNSNYGFKQLSEVAIKALSPGINDPGTAVLSLNALFEMFACKMECILPLIRKDSENIARIFIPHATISEMFETYIRPVWQYGKNDMFIQQELLFLIKQLKMVDNKNLLNETLDKFIELVEN